MIKFIKRLIFIPIRFKRGLNYVIPNLFNLFVWTFDSKETTNYTYHLWDMNIKYLASFISEATNTPYETVMTYFKEIQEDKKLTAHLQELNKKSDLNYKSDYEIRFGRRIGWYALVRILKPKIVIETGVDKGLGSCVITAALLRNAEENLPGEYFGTDINPKAGYLLQGEYAKMGKILYGDSIESLKKFEHKIDIFINDSDHSSEYEAQEYEVINPKMNPKGIIIGDNAHGNSKLLEFCLKTNRKFCFFKEHPKNHFFSGAGIGLGLPKN